MSPLLTPVQGGFRGRRRGGERAGRRALRDDEEEVGVGDEVPEREPLLRGLLRPDLDVARRARREREHHARHLRPGAAGRGGAGRARAVRNGRRARWECAAGGGSGWERSVCAGGRGRAWALLALVKKLRSLAVTGRLTESDTTEARRKHPWATILAPACRRGRERAQAVRRPHNRPREPRGCHCPASAATALGAATASAPWAPGSPSHVRCSAQREEPVSTDGGRGLWVARRVELVENARDAVAAAQRRPAVERRGGRARELPHLDAERPGEGLGEGGGDVQGELAAEPHGQARDELLGRGGWAGGGWRGGCQGGCEYAAGDGGG